MTLQVNDMKCNHCVERIHKVLSEAGITHEISLEKKQVEITGDEAAVAKAIEEMDDIGFTGVRV